MEQLRKTYYKLTLQFLYPPAWIAASDIYKKLPYHKKLRWDPPESWESRNREIRGTNEKKLKEMALLFQQYMEYERGIPTRIVRNL